MGRSVSYPSNAQVITFKSFHGAPCDCSDATSALSEEDVAECEDCGGSGWIDGFSDFDDLIEDFREYLKTLFPSVEQADSWIGREDHVLASNKLARFGMSEYCGLVSYWIVPNEYEGSNPDEPYYSSNRDISALSQRWVSQVADKFVAAFGELSKIGSMSNGEGVYRRIDR